MREVFGRVAVTALAVASVLLLRMPSAHAATWLNTFRELLPCSP